MKKFDLLTAASNGILALLIGLSGIGCLVTGMELGIRRDWILFACLFWAVFPNVVLQFKHGWLITLAAMGLWGLVFWKMGLVQDTMTLLNRITWVYHQAYGWGQPDYLLPYTGTQTTMALAAIASVCTLLAGLGLSTQRGHGVLTAALLPVVPCLVVTDTVPATGWLFVLTVCLALVVLSRNVRSLEPKRASRLVAFLLIPVLLASWLLFRTYPKDSHHSNTQQADFRQGLMDFLDGLPILQVEDGEISLDFSDIPTIGTAPDWGALMPTVSVEPSELPLPTFTLDPGLLDVLNRTVSLANLGPRDPGTTKVMTVTTKYRGTLYLREQGYDRYTGTAWERSEEPQLLEMDRRYLSTKDTVAIKTSLVQNHYFVPYYTVVNALALSDGIYENPDGAVSYSFGAYALRENWRSIWQAESGAAIGQVDAYTQYLDLPDETRDQAAAIVRDLGITESTDVLSAAQTIQNYVTGSARYDLNTQTMPQEYDDFALWFLTRSETGYCVHFATAATVLLRAAGIPARYVEGYIVPVSSNATTVTSDLAHAWVEYYLPQMGWVVLEATPSDGDSPIPETTLPPVPTTVPTEPVTTAPTEPTTTAPTLPTQPSTIPTQTTVPVTTAPAATTAATVSTTLPQEPATPSVDRTDLWRDLAILFSILGLACGIYGQWQLRLWIKAQWRRRGSANQQAIALWRESQRLAALRRQKVPAALRDLAWKAKYSQHTISQEELQIFEAYLQRSVTHLKERPWYLRLIYRLVFAAY